MNVRPLLVAVIFLLLCSLVLAESYQIRVTWPVRLRASFSLSSPIVAKTLAGDVLQVVGRFNRWLKIERDGATAWLADWVEYTRLDQEQAPAAQPATNQQQRPNIDNCCFVNRQCHSDREWLEGYWAYQRNECPAQPQPGLAPAPIAVGSHPGIHIDGSDRFRSQVQAALDLIRQRSGRWYHYLISGLDRVQQIQSGERYVDVYQRTYYLTDNVAFLWGEFLTDASLTWLAGVLVHESCHVYARQHGLTYGNEYERFREEVICQQIQIESLEDIDVPHNRWREYLSGLINNWIAEGHVVPRDVINELKQYPR